MDIPPEVDEGSTRVHQLCQLIFESRQDSQSMCWMGRMAAIEESEAKRPRSGRARDQNKRDRLMGISPVDLSHEEDGFGDMIRKSLTT